MESHAGKPSIFVARQAGSAPPGTGPRRALKRARCAGLSERSASRSARAKASRASAHGAKTETGDASAQAGCQRLDAVGHARTQRGGRQLPVPVLSAAGLGFRNAGIRPASHAGLPGHALESPCLAARLESLAPARRRVPDQAHADGTEPGDAAASSGIPSRAVSDRINRHPSSCVGTKTPGIGWNIQDWIKAAQAKQPDCPARPPNRLLISI